MLESRFKKNFINLVLVVLSTIIALVILEVIIRFTPYKNIGASYKYPAQYFVADAEIGYDIIKNKKHAIHGLQDHPYEVFSNSYGCFDYERKVPNDYGIIVGDSFTWGYAPLPDKWTSYIENKSGIFMMKCGITGHGTMQEMKKAKRVIKQVGKNPKYIIMLYTANDFNDDFFFPSRTVIGDGSLVSKSKGANFINGERFFYSDEDLQNRNKEYAKFKYKLVTYRIFLSAKNFLEKKLQELQRPKLTQRVHMPEAVSNYYDICMIDYSDDKSRQWYNQALVQHKKNIKDFALYAKSIGAKFLFIDMSGVLQYDSMKELRKFFEKNENVYLYDLSNDYPKQSRWKHDSHWDIKGNQEAGEWIYQGAVEVGFFKNPQY